MAKTLRQATGSQQAGGRGVVKLGEKSWKWK